MPISGPSITRMGGGRRKKRSGLATGVDLVSKLSDLMTNYMYQRGKLQELKTKDPENVERLDRRMESYKAQIQQYIKMIDEGGDNADIEAQLELSRQAGSTPPNIELGTEPGQLVKMQGVRSREEVTRAKTAAAQALEFGKEYPQAPSQVGMDISVGKDVGTAKAFAQDWERFKSTQKDLEEQHKVSFQTIGKMDELVQTKRHMRKIGEDIGLGDPMGLVVVTSAAQAFDYIGLPEGVYPIVEATLYLATAPKSNTATSYFKAFQLIEDEGIGDVPQHLQDSNRDAVALGHGSGYKYPHESPDHFLPQQYLPRPLLGTYFYTPSNQGYEADVAGRLEHWRAAQRQALGITKTEEIPELTQETILEIKRKHKTT